MRALFVLFAIVVALWTSPAYAQLPTNVLNVANRTYGADQQPVNTTSGALNVAIAGSTSGASSSVNVAAVGGVAVTAASAAADNATLPTTGFQKSVLMGYDGISLDLLRVDAVDNQATVTGVLNTLAVGEYNATPPTITDTRFQHSQIDVRGNQKASLWTGAQAATYGAFTAATSAPGALNNLPLIVYNATPPSFTDGQYGHEQMDSRGNRRISIFGANGTSGVSVQAPADGQSTATVSLTTDSRNSNYTGTTWDRVRSIITGTNSTGTGITAVGLVGQVDDTSPTTITENQFGNVRMDSNRFLLTGEQNSYTNITTNASFAVKTSAGVLHSLTINTRGTGSTAIVYDGANCNAGTTVTAVATVDTTLSTTAFLYDTFHSAGICIVTAGASPANLTASSR